MKISHDKKGWKVHIIEKRAKRHKGMKVSHDKKGWKEANNIEEGKQHESKGCKEHIT